MKKKTLEEILEDLLYEYSDEVSEWYGTFKYCHSDIADGRVEEIEKEIGRCVENVFDFYEQHGIYFPSEIKDHIYADIKNKVLTKVYNELKRKLDK